MPKLSYGSIVQKRVKEFLHLLLSAAFWPDDIDGNFRWAKSEGSIHKLSVKSTLQGFVNLSKKYGSSDKLNKEQVRMCIICLENFLKILEDNRTQTQGSKYWEFTLNLWSRDIEENLRQFDIAWEQCKLKKIGANQSSSVVDSKSDLKYERYLSILKQNVDVWNNWREKNHNVIPKFEKVNLRGISIARANLSGANFNDVDLTGADFSKANLSEANFNDVVLTGADFSKANLNEANFNGVVLTGADFSKANLSEANFNDVVLTGADFSKANLSEANFNDVVLTGADFSKANLSEANFSKVDLTEADLSNANLSKTSALNTNFTGAILTGSNLEDWNINITTNLDHVICDYVYLKDNQQQRNPSDPSKFFAPGEFTKLVQETLKLTDSRISLTYKLRSSLEEIIVFSRMLTEEIYGSLNPKQMQYTRAIVTTGEHLLDLLNDYHKLGNIDNNSEISYLSHELRSPFAAILGFSRMLTEEIYGSLNSKQMQYTKQILTIGENLLDLVNDYLDVAKINAQQEMLYLENIKLKELCQACLSIVQEKAKQKGLEIIFRIGDNINSCVADRLRLKQILVNLIINAIKFTHKGSVTLQVELKQDKFYFSVIDTGIGISATNIQNIFKPFQTFTDHHEGTGLGLALSRKLAQLHGGDITVTSEEGKGSIFTLHLPQNLRPTD